MPEEAVKLDKPRHGDIRQVHSDEGVYPRLTDAHGLQIPHQTVGISVSGRLGSVQVMRGWVGSYSPDQDGMCNFASSDTRPPRRQGSDNNQSQRVMRVQMSIRLDIGINVRAFCGYISPQVRCEMDNRIHVKDAYSLPMCGDTPAMVAPRATSVIHKNMRSKIPQYTRTH